MPPDRPPATPLRSPAARLAAALILLSLCPGPARAETADQLSPSAYLAWLQQLAQSPPPPKPVAGRGTTIGVPGGFSLPAGTVFVALAASDHRRGSTTRARQDADASAAIGIGFGDAVNAVGLDVTLGIDSLDPQDIGDSGALSVKLSRVVGSPLPGQAGALALGAGNVAAWGDSKAADSNYYLAYTSTFAFDTPGRVIPGLVSLGYGTRMGAGENRGGLFLSAGIGVTDWLSLAVGRTTDELHLGLSAHRKLGSYDAQLGLSLVRPDGGQSDRLNLALALMSPKLF